MPTYDLTNLATVEGWPLVVTVVDVAWGTTSAALATLVSVRAARRLRQPKPREHAHTEDAEHANGH